MKRFVVLLVSALFLLSQSSDATIERPGSLHWPSASRPLRLIDSVKTRWQPALDSAAADWSAGLTNLDLTVVTSSTRRAIRKRCRPSSGAVHVCNFRYGANKPWAGLASYSYNPANGHFVSASIKLNDSTTRGASANILKVITCHEIGHTLGLDHDNDAGSCMTPSANNGATTPSLTDLAGVDDNYLLHGLPDSTSMARAATTAEHNPDGTVTVRVAFPALT